MRVLFVGNSYTHVENLPHVVAAFAEDRGIDLVTRKSTVGGVTLEEHWKGLKGLQTREIIETGAFDVVVLQEQSTRPVREPEETIRYAKLLCELIKENGATPYLYLTWAREHDPPMQDGLTQTYMRAGREGGAVVVPAGLAWEEARKRRSDIELFDADGSHPAKLGTYLTACVFFKVLTGEEPAGLPFRVMMTDAEGESVILMKVPESDAAFCQQVASEVVAFFTDSIPK